MNHPKLLIPVYSAILAFASFFAGNAANKRFTFYSNLWYKHGFECTKFSNEGVWTTGVYSRILFVTANGASVQIFTTSGCNTTPVSVALVS